VTSALFLSLMLAPGQTDGLGPATGANAAEVPAARAGVGITQRINDAVPLDLPFRDEAGRAVRLGDFFTTKPIVLVPAYFRCPQLCTQVLNGLVDGLRGVSLGGGDFEVVVFSFDARETPELAAAKKANYLEKYGRPGAEASWHFLTGDQDSIDRLTGAIGYRVRYDEKQDLFAHGSGVVLLTPQGRVSRYLLGIGFPARDLRLGLVEASQGHVGSVVDQMLLYCYHYDPATGGYAATAMGLVRLGGVLTVLALVAFLGVAWLRERRRARPDVQPAG
jgi:protein SCO1/2